MLRPQLVRSTAGGLLEYRSWLDDLAVEQRSKEVTNSAAIPQSTVEGLDNEAHLTTKLTGPADPMLMSA